MVYVRTVRALACVIIFAACSYSDPKLDNTHFRCDSGGKCPSGQKCAGSLCVAATHDGVACTTPCGADEQCCDDGTNPLRCIPATDNCLGNSAFCDEASDCQSGSRCCAVGIDQQCDLEDSCAQFACQAASDCLSEAPNCCDDDPVKPWKICRRDPC
jgi:hypothetical protein